MRVCLLVYGNISPYVAPMAVDVGGVFVACRAAGSRVTKPEWASALLTGPGSV